MCPGPELEYCTDAGLSGAAASKVTGAAGGGPASETAVGIDGRGAKIAMSRAVRKYSRLAALLPLRAPHSQ